MSQYLGFFPVCVVFVNWSEKNDSAQYASSVPKGRASPSKYIPFLEGHCILLPSTLSWYEFPEIWNHPSHPQNVPLTKAPKKIWSRSAFNWESGQLSKIHFLWVFSVSEEDKGSVLQNVLLQWMTLRFLDRKRRHSYRFSFSFSFLYVEDSEIAKDSFRDHSVLHASIRCPQFFFITFFQ